MARPRKQPQERRTTNVDARVTIAERCYVQQQAVKAGLSEAAYVRQRVLDYEVRAKACANRSDPALISELNSLGTQVQKLGNLANQIALYCHTDRRLPTGWEVLPYEIKALLKVIEIKLEQELAKDGS